MYFLKISYIFALMVSRFSKKNLESRFKGFEFEFFKSSTWGFKIFRLRRNLAKGGFNGGGFRFNTVVLCYLSFGALIALDFSFLL